MCRVLGLAYRGALGSAFLTSPHPESPPLQASDGPVSFLHYTSPTRCLLYTMLAFVPQ